jgi:hypothetical protein
VPVTAMPYAEAPPEMQAAVRLLRLLVMLDPSLEDELIDLDQRDVDNFYNLAAPAGRSVP